MSHLPASTLTWLVRHTGFPAHRLPAQAEIAVLFAAAAAADEAETSAAARASKPREGTAEAVSQRQLAFNRKHAHYKSDNRAKV